MTPERPTLGERLEAAAASDDPFVPAERWFLRYLVERAFGWKDDPWEFEQILELVYSHGLRVCTDLDHFYLTCPAAAKQPPAEGRLTEQPGKWGPLSEVLLVAGRADSFKELQGLIYRLAGIWRPRP